ncbi:MAG: MBL fold metallo-hydrolase [Candidatus Pacearchaeota archaeon]|jgi:hydroxyacylglutathione hydrolase
MILQLRIGTMANICYILWDEKTKEGAVIDPGWESDKIIKQIKDLGIKLKYILLTHLHFDHYDSVPDIKKATNAETVCNKKENVSEIIDKHVKEGDSLYLGSKKIKVIDTPGHTAGGVCYLFDEKYLFAGDTLFCKGGYGRTDLPGGSESQMKESLKKLMKLDENIIVYPGHNYSNCSESTIKNEKEFLKKYGVI